MRSFRSPRIARGTLVTLLTVLAPAISMGQAKPGEWLDRHHEDGQTFDEYIKGEPNRPTINRTTFYILPLGGFDKKRQKLI